MRHRVARALAAGVMIAAVPLLAACGKSEDSSSSSGSSGGVKTGPGVTADTITLGVQTDLSGVFAALGSVITQSNQLYWKQQNAKGGVCDRKVKIIVKDHGYDPQTAVTQYRDLSSKVAALQQVVGSPVSAAELPTWERENMLAILAAWPPSLLAHKPIGIIGASYDVEAINGIDWMMKNKGLKKGGTIGDLYFEGDYGEGGLVGVKAAADKFGLKVVEQKIKATDTDMSAAASAFKKAGVDAIWVTVGPKQLASLAGTAKAIGLDVPIGGNGPVFSPLLLDTAVGKTLEKNLTVFASSAPISLDKEAVQQARSAYAEAYPKGTPQSAVVTGWLEADVMKQTLEKACEGKDLSRKGILDSFRKLSNVDTGGLTAGPLDFTQVGQPSSKAIYVAGVDRKAAGGQKVIDGPLTADAVKDYSPPTD
jgi:ABC-type branched-subunit amino acid transport system substrate-binding protein